MKTTAAILVELGKPLEVVSLEIEPLRAGQVLVEIHYSGVCHTQLLEAQGHRGPDPYVPHCLGHEGSGVVLKAGPGVTRVEAGDRVVCSWIKGEGKNVPGTTYRWGDRKVNAGGITTFGRRMVISENRLWPLPDGLAMRDAAALGCALPTGLGVVFNTASPSPGQSLAVFGAGGVGLCAVAGAAIAGCFPVVAIDLLPRKLDVARKLGATHTILASQEDVSSRLAKLCPGGLDFVVEATGSPEVMAEALRGVRSRGGVAIVVGNARSGRLLEIDPKELNQGKQLCGTWGGDTVPSRDFPRYGRLIQAGKIDLASLFGGTYALEDVNVALRDLEEGRVIRPLIDMTPP